MITRQKFNPKKIEVVVIDKEEAKGFSINYGDIFTLWFAEESEFFEMTYVNLNYKEELVEKLVNKTLEHMISNPKGEQK